MSWPFDSETRRLIIIARTRPVRLICTFENIPADKLCEKRISRRWKLPGPVSYANVCKQPPGHVDRVGRPRVHDAHWRDGRLESFFGFFFFVFFCLFLVRPQQFKTNRPHTTSVVLSFGVQKDKNKTFVIPG